MKKVELHSIDRMINSDLYSVYYTVSGVIYVKHNVAISLYGYTFDKNVGVDDFNISLHVVKDKE